MRGPPRAQGRGVPRPPNKPDAHPSRDDGHGHHLCFFVSKSAIEGKYHPVYAPPGDVVVARARAGGALFDQAYKASWHDLMSFSGPEITAHLTSLFGPV